VFNSVAKSFKSHISEVTWMDESTRNTALDKADFVDYKIGYPDFVVHPKQLDDYYQQVLPVVAFLCHQYYCCLVIYLLSLLTLLLPLIVICFNPLKCSGISWLNL